MKHSVVIVLTLAALVSFLKINAQEACTAGFFGSKCQLPCRCKNSRVCDKETGDCPDEICAQNFTDMGCQYELIEPVTDPDIMWAVDGSDSTCANPEDSYLKIPSQPYSVITKYTLVGKPNSADSLIKLKVIVETGKKDTPDPYRKMTDYRVEFFPRTPVVTDHFALSGAAVGLLCEVYMIKGRDMTHGVKTALSSQLNKGTDKSDAFYAVDSNNGQNYKEDGCAHSAFSDRDATLTITLEQPIRVLIYYYYTFDVRGKCPAGFDISVDGAKCHLKNTENNYYGKAREACFEVGADLAVFLSIHELKQVKDIGNFKYNCTIGLNDRKREGNYVWLDGIEDDSDLQNNWMPGQPDNSGNEDCVQVHVDKISDFQCERYGRYCCAIDGTVTAMEMLIIGYKDNKREFKHTISAYSNIHFGLMTDTRQIVDKFVLEASKKYKVLHVCEFHIIGEPECPTGHFGLECQYQCHCKKGGCTATGFCQEGCAPGYFEPYCTELCPEGTYAPPTCSKNCSSNCVGGICSFVEGTCVQGCKTGFYGLQCDKSCPSSCKDACDMNNGNCLNGCDDGFFGIKCENQCPTNCYSCNFQSGSCNRCTPGLYGSSCEKNCPVSCVGPCEFDSGNCVGGCVDGVFGQTCDKKCPKNCDNGICDILNGTCNGCKPGFYGYSCEKSCPVSCVGPCEVESGSCVEGCVEGVFGLTCDQECPENCRNGNCDFVNGTCNGCVDGFFGLSCEQGCPRNCYGACDVIDGTCKGGCIDGLFGIMCDQECPRNCYRCDFFNGTCTGCAQSMFGLTCEEECPKNCYNGTCDFLNGTCTGCITGYYGVPTCEMECPYCNGECEFETGQCFAGCRPGYWGGSCSTLCSKSCEKDCDPETGECPDSDSEVVLVVGSVLLALLTCLICACLVLKKWNEQKEQEQPGEVVEDEANKEDVPVQKQETAPQVPVTEVEEDGRVSTAL